MAKFEVNIDWKLLAQQKRALLKLYFDNAGNERKHIEGVINMIDEIQDQANDQGEPVVWLSENKESI